VRQDQCYLDLENAARVQPVAVTSAISGQELHHKACVSNFRLAIRTIHDVGFKDISTCHIT